MSDTPTRKPPEHSDFHRSFERPAGHAVVAMFVALLAGLILNANGLMATARQLPYGSTTRSVSITLLRPVNDVTDALFLNSPREGLRWALGRHSQGTTGDPFANAPTVTAPQSTGTTPATGGNSTPNTNGGTGPSTGPSTAGGSPTLPKPTPANPLRVLVIGDSLAGDFGPTLLTDAEATKVIKPAGAVDYHISTGLTRPDVFDWPGELQSAIDRDHPTTVVIALGLNDAQQPMTLPDGTFLSRGSPGWRTEYRKRVGAMISIAQASGARVIYVAPPPVSEADSNPYLFSINVQIVKEAKDHQDTASVFTYPMFAVHSQYSAYLPIDGKQVLVRTPDGIHLSPAGNDILSAAVMKTLGTLYDLPPSK
jgi:lysophospholipase L1-like esterase